MSTYIAEINSDSNLDNLKGMVVDHIEVESHPTITGISSFKIFFRNGTYIQIMGNYGEGCNADYFSILG